MIVHDCIQGSPEWHALRLGKLTASRADAILTPARLGPSKQRHAMMGRLNHEWLTGSSSEQFKGTAWTEHGHNLEGEAADWFALTTSMNPQVVGFIEADNGLAGCSPDLWVPGECGVELKCPAGWTHIQYLNNPEVVPREYVLQVQYSIWLTGLPWYFMSYAASPQDDGLLPVWKPGAYLPPMLLRVDLEPEYQDAFDEHLPVFFDEMSEQREWLLSIGGTPWTRRQAA